MNVRRLGVGAAAALALTASWLVPTSAQAAPATPAKVVISATLPAASQPQSVGVRTPARSTVSKLPKRCRTAGRVLCINKTSRKLRYLKNGRIISTTDARFGCWRTPTRSGTFRVYRKSYNHTSSIYHTWMPRAMFFSGGQAVHYSPDFAARGYNGCSHGCVNIRNWSKINYIYSQIRVGDKVVIYSS